MQIGPIEEATLPAGAGGPPAGTAPAVVVDLDGTLIKGDMLVEGLCQVGAGSLPRALRLLWSLRRAPHRLKAEVTRHAAIDPATLPYNEALVAWLREQAGQGRPILLATASHRSVAEGVARHLGLFDGVLATEGERNLKGAAKLAAIREALGDRPFTYVGDDASDLAVWAGAAEAATVNLRPSVRAGLARLGKDGGPRFDFRQDSAADLLRGMRPHQWFKNVLVFLPLLAAHRWTEPGLLLLALLAFACFSLSASGVYLINDLLDIEDDRHHPEKRRRPVAAGLLRPQAALAAALALIAGSLLAGALAAPLLALTVAAYIVATSLYSLSIKTKPGIDVLWLAGLYTLRVIAGAAVTGIVTSNWLLSFCLFLFLSLASAKRCSELMVHLARPAEMRSRRGYQVDDLEVMTITGIVSGFSAVIVLMIYLQDGAVAGLYAQPNLLILSGVVLLHWLTRLWLKVRRGQMHHDPMVYALTDRHSRIALGVMALCFLAASVVP